MQWKRSVGLLVRLVSTAHYPSSLSHSLPFSVYNPFMFTCVCVVATTMSAVVPTAVLWPSVWFLLRSDRLKLILHGRVKCALHLTQPGPGWKSAVSLVVLLKNLIKL